MFKQTDQNFDGEINRFGCCLFSCLQVAEWETGKEFTVDQVKELIVKLKKEKKLLSNCYCQDILGIIDSGIRFLNPEKRGRTRHCFDIADGQVFHYYSKGENRFLMIYYKTDLKKDNFHVVVQDMKTKKYFNPDERLKSFDQLYRIRGFVWTN